MDIQCFVICHLVFTYIGPTCLFYLKKSSSIERAGSTSFCENALIPRLLKLSIFGKYLIRLINNFTKIKTDYAHLPLLGARANHYFSHQP